jgi:hypothetical protein
MADPVTISDRDELLGRLLSLLADRGIARKWAATREPQATLDQECTAVASDPQRLRLFGDYLRAKPVVQRSVDNLLAHISVAANARREHLPPPQDVLFGAGWRIARWLPTFLVIDGPLGRFLRAADSPLNAVLKVDHARYPILAQARDLFSDDLFRRLRNGVGHWAFAFEQGPGGERLICFDYDTGERTADVTLLEAEAFHLASFAVIECLDQRIFRVANPRVSNRE